MADEGEEVEVEVVGLYVKFCRGWLTLMQAQ